MARRKDNPEPLAIPDLPWSLGIVIAGLLYAGLRLLLIGHPGGGPFLSLLTNIVRANAGLVLMLVGLGAFFTFSKSGPHSNRYAEVDLDAVRALPFAEFKRLCGDAFGALGYGLQMDRSSRSPAHADLTLRRGKELTLVHCSRWRSLHVGIKEIRELHDAVIASRARLGIFVTAGTFSGAATLFARGKPLALIDGDGLARLLSTRRERTNRGSEETDGRTIRMTSALRNGAGSASTEKNRRTAS